MTTTPQTSSPPELDDHDKNLTERALAVLTAATDFTTGEVFALPVLKTTTNSIYAKAHDPDAVRAVLTAWLTEQAAAHGRTLPSWVTTGSGRDTAGYLHAAVAVLETGAVRLRIRHHELPPDDFLETILSEEDTFQLCNALSLAAVRAHRMTCTNEGCEL